MFYVIKFFGNAAILIISFSNLFQNLYVDSICIKSICIKLNSNLHPQMKSMHEIENSYLTKFVVLAENVF